MKHCLPEDAIEIGRIAGAWGVKGAVRVIPYSDDAQTLFSGAQWYLMPPERSGQVLPGLASVSSGSWPLILNITDIRDQGESIVAMISEICDRDHAQSLRGGRIFVSRSQFPDLGEDEFYWVDLIGMKVFNRQDVYLGEVIGLMSNGIQSILRVVDATANDIPLSENTLKEKAKKGAKAEKTRTPERLIPFVDAFIEKVDREAKVVFVDWQPDY